MQTLLRAVIAGWSHDVADELAGLSEPERRALAPELLRFARTPFGQERLSALHVALAGTATLPEIRRFRRTWIDAESGAKVLLDRRPDWLPEYAEWLLGGESEDEAWYVVRALVRAGAIPRPSSPEYLGALVGASRNRDAARLVADDPALIEHELWALLRSDTGAESLRAADDATLDPAGWNALFRALIADGRMPRGRGLDALLDGLAADLSAYRAAWQLRLWKDLRPSAAELSERTDQLRVLLGAAEAPIASFAVKELLRAKADVPPAELVPVLTAPAKTTVRGALRLLGKQPALATVALGHPDADIQREVLDRLERWGLDDGARDGLLRHLDLLAATQRPRAEALLGLTLPQAEAPAGADVEGIPEAIRFALNVGGPVPDAPVPGEPVLGEPIPPIASVEELATELSGRRSNWELDERVLDALLRFCDQPFTGPAHFYRRPDDDGMPALNRIAYAWLHREVVPADGGWLADEEERVARGVAGPLLSLPTHAGGWIDPRVLVDRMHEHASERDLATALLRLAPDHRAEALEAARDMPGRTGALLRCALGGDDVDGADAPAVAARAVRLPPLVTVEASVRFRESVIDGDVFVPFVRPAGLREGPLEFPLRRDLTAAYAMRRLSWNLGSTSSDYTDVPELLAVLIPPTEPIAPLVLRLTTAALSSTVDREHLTAVDLLIAAIDDGRVDALPLDDIEHLMPNRLAARLAVIAAAGPFQRAVVLDFLDALVTTAPERPTPLLVLLDELCAQTNSGPHHSRTHLATFIGSSKAAKAAKALLAREGAVDRTDLALAARVRRARRWMAAVAQHP